MPDRSSPPQSRHFWPALAVLASLGTAEAAPPAGKPVFIHVERLAPTSVGRMASSWPGTSRRRRLLLDAHFRSDATSAGGLGTGYVSRDGKTIVPETVLDADKTQQAARWQGGTVVAACSDRLVPECPSVRPTCSSIGPPTSADGRVLVGLVWYGSARPSVDLSGLPLGRVHGYGEPRQHG